MAKNSSPRSGRVTPSKRAVADRQRAAVSSDAGNRRSTPPKPKFRLRPRWHRVVGWLILVAGISIIALNDGMLMGEDLVLLPGGHNELYLLLGVAVGGCSTWFLGLFDRETTVYA